MSKNINKKYIDKEIKVLNNINKEYLTDFLKKLKINFTSNSNKNQIINLIIEQLKFIVKNINIKNIYKSEMNNNFHIINNLLSIKKEFMELKKIKFSNFVINFKKESNNLSTLNNLKIELKKYYNPNTGVFKQRITSSNKYVFKNNISRETKNKVRNTQKRLKDIESNYKNLLINKINLNNEINDIIIKNLNPEKIKKKNSIINHLTIFKMRKKCDKCDGNHNTNSCPYFPKERENNLIFNKKIQEYRNKFKYSNNISNNILKNYDIIEAGGGGHCGYLSIIAYCNYYNIKLFPDNFNFHKINTETNYSNSKKLKLFIYKKLENFKNFEKLIKSNPYHFGEFVSLFDKDLDENKEIRRFHNNLISKVNNINSAEWIDEEMLLYISAIINKVILVINNKRDTSNRLFIPPSDKPYEWQENYNSKKNYLLSDEVIKLYNFDNIHYNWLRKK